MAGEFPSLRGEVILMKSFVDDKDHSRPAHNALNTDTINGVEGETEEHRVNEIANKAAGKAMERQRQDESGQIFSK
jgi:hypothetical protein